jgi:hypothetical protein
VSSPSVVPVPEFGPGYQAKHGGIFNPNAIPFGEYVVTENPNNDYTVSHGGIIQRDGEIYRPQE